MKYEKGFNAIRQLGMFLLDEGDEGTAKEVMILYSHARMSVDRDEYDKTLESTANSLVDNMKKHIEKEKQKESENKIIEVKH